MSEVPLKPFSAPEPSSATGRTSEVSHSSDEPEAGYSGMGMLREWTDALVLAFLLAMFVRTFVVELFKIPSGSMSPTLLGGVVAEGKATDEAGDLKDYVFVHEVPLDRVQIFERSDTKEPFRYRGRRWLEELTESQRELAQGAKHVEEHRILVNKFAYWFHPPRRGDIAIFRVPFRAERNRNIYVKRVVGLGGETIGIGREGRLQINGEQVEEPPIFRIRQYMPSEWEGALPYQGYVEFHVPPGQVYMFGDNSGSSYDSRCWGGVPLGNFRGKAFLRYWPRSKFTLL